MEEINFESVDFEGEDLKTYTKELLNAEIRVFIHHDNKRITYLTISKGDNVGYVERSYFGGLSFTTKHKPNSESGTGYQIEDGVVNPKIENALRTFAYKPYWAMNDNVEIQKYKDINEYFKSERVLKYKEVVL